MTTSRISLRTALVLLVAGTVTLAGCVVATEPEEDVMAEDTSSSSDAIVNGTNVAATHPEAARIDGTGGTVPANQISACSGTLIAPMVVLTAGHCIKGPTTWTVKVGAESRTTTSSAVYDWNAASTIQTAHDIGLLFLSQPIWLQTYPTIVQTSALNAKVMNVGRVLNTAVTNDIWGAKTTTGLMDGAMLGVPFYYFNTEILTEGGDSGGPAFLVVKRPDSTEEITHQIVAVTSSRQNVPGRQFLARVDLLHGWIMQQITAHPAPAPTNTQISCVFNWAEAVYPNLFSPAAQQPLQSAPPFLYRYYPGTNSYLGAAWASASAPHQAVMSPSSTYPVKHVFFMDSAGTPQDHGTVGYWMKQANCL